MEVAAGLTDTLQIKDVVQTGQIPDWFPDQLREKMSQGGHKPSKLLIGAIDMSLGRHGVDLLANEFNLAKWDKRGLSISDREVVLKALGISHNTLSEYLQARLGVREREGDSISKTKRDALKKEIATQILTVATEIYERNRPHREKEIKDWDKIKSLGRVDYAIAFGKAARFFTPRQKPADKLLGQIYAIPEHLEVVFNEEQERNS